jgi:hypothetical protein
VPLTQNAVEGPDPRIRPRIQIGMFRPIRVDHTNCLQVAIKTHSFIHYEWTGAVIQNGNPEGGWIFVVVYYKSKTRSEESI